MTCPRCQTENPPQAKFCLECAATLVARCAQLRHPAARVREVLPGVRASRRRGDPGPPRFASPESDTPKHLAERILTSQGALEGERKQAPSGADLKGSMELPPTGTRGGSGAPRSRPRADDGGRPSLRGHGQPGHGRRDHGAVRRAARPRGPRRPRLLCRPADAGGAPALRRGDAAGTPGVTIHIRGPELRRGGRALDRLRPPHGLHRGGPDHPSGRAHGAARRSRGPILLHPRNPAPSPRASSR